VVTALQTPWCHPLGLDGPRTVLSFWPVAICGAELEALRSRHHATFKEESRSVRSATIPATVIDNRAKRGRDRRGSTLTLESRSCRL